MKAKDKKAIAALNEQIVALQAREKLIEKEWDDIWESGDRDLYNAKVNQLSPEWDGIDPKIAELRDQIRRIKDQDLYDKGYYHELSLARANID